MAGWEEPCHPGPVQREPHFTPLSPTMQHIAGIFPTGLFFPLQSQKSVPSRLRLEISPAGEAEAEPGVQLLG